MMKETDKFFYEINKEHNFVAGFTKRQGTIEEFLAQPFLKDVKASQMKQIHSANVKFIEKMPQENYSIISDTDAQFTTQKNLVLLARAADCLPILIYHPYPLISAIHAGRKGTEQRILPKTLAAIKEKFGLAAGFKFWFGPAICVDCYQIDRELDLHYDLVGENLKQLSETLDLNTVKTYNTNLCTVCRNDIFYSYRKEGDTAGRFYGAIVLKGV